MGKNERRQWQQHPKKEKNFKPVSLVYLCMCMCVWLYQQPIHCKNIKTYARNANKLK